MIFQRIDARGDFPSNFYTFHSEMSLLNITGIDYIS